MENTRREFVQMGLGAAVAAGVVGAATASAEEVDGPAPEKGCAVGPHAYQKVTTQYPLMDSTIEFHHLMIVYRSIDKALELWRDVMGFDVISDGPTAGEWYEPEVWDDLFGVGKPATFRCCCLQHDTGAMLELHEPIDPPLTELPEDAFDYWHPGVLEIGLRVRNIDGWLEKIKAAGYETTTDYVWDCADRGRSFLFKDCDGHMIQLWECEKHPHW